MVWNQIMWTILFPHSGLNECYGFRSCSFSTCRVIVTVVDGHPVLNRERCLSHGPSCGDGKCPVSNLTATSSTYLESNNLHRKSSGSTWTHLQRHCTSRHQKFPNLHSFWFFQFWPKHTGQNEQREYGSSKQKKKRILNENEAPVAAQPRGAMRRVGTRNAGIKDSLQSHLSWGCLSTPDLHFFSIRVISDVALEPAFIWQPTSVSPGYTQHSANPGRRQWLSTYLIFSIHSGGRRHYLQAIE